MVFIIIILVDLNDILSFLYLQFALFDLVLLLDYVLVALFAASAAPMALLALATFVYLLFLVINGNSKRASIEVALSPFAERVFTSHLLLHFLGENAKVALESGFHLGQETNFQNVIFNQVKLEVLLAEAFELNYRDRLETLLYRCHDSKWVARDEDQVVLVTVFS